MDRNATRFVIRRNSGADNTYVSYLSTLLYQLRKLHLRRIEQAVSWYQGNNLGLFTFALLSGGNGKGNF